MTPSLHSRRAILGLGGTVLTGVGTAGCLGGSQPTQTVTMTEDFGFDPKTVRVDVGGRVEWTNDSAIGHTVTAYEAEIPEEASYFASGGFSSEREARTNLSEGLVNPDGQYGHTFEQSGRYEYFCLPHEGSGMVGTVRVG